MTAIASSASAADAGATHMHIHVLFVRANKNPLRKPGKHSDKMERASAGASGQLTERITAPPIAQTACTITPSMPFVTVTLVLVIADELAMVLAAYDDPVGFSKRTASLSGFSEGFKFSFRQSSIVSINES